MKQTSSSRFGYSEMEMADAFQDILASADGLPGIGAFDSVYREVNCRQGRPDFISLRRKNNSPDNCFPSTIGFTGASIISLLKTKAPRTLPYLISHSEFTAESIRRSLCSLLASGHVNRSGTKSYILGPKSKVMAVEIWAFELKLDNPKRAVFQAQQCRSFAQQSIIVVPPSQAKNYKRYQETMKRWGIGLATFDPATGDFSIAKRSRKAPALSRQNQVYTLSKLGEQLIAGMAPMHR